MSNSTFKSVKNIVGSLSELNVSGDAQVHDTLSASGISADIMVQLPPGKTLQSVKLTGPSGTYDTLGGTALTKMDGIEYKAPSKIEVVGAVLSTSVAPTQTINLGDTGTATSLFSGVVTADALAGVYVSSIAAAGLGTGGAKVTSASVAKDDKILLDAGTNTANFVPSVTLYYYV